MVKAIKTRARSFRQEINFRRAIQHVPRRQRPGLRHWLRRQAKIFSARTPSQLDPTAVRQPAELPGLAPPRDTRTFYELDPDTGHWRRL